MSELPAITVSSLDADRLWAILDRCEGQSEVIPRLMDELDRARVVAPDEVPGDVVRMNSKVTFEHEESGQSHELELVWPNEIDGSDHKVSVLAPAGAALLGLTVGDTIEWPMAGNRKIHYRIIAVQA